MVYGGEVTAYWNGVSVSGTTVSVTIEIDSGFEWVYVDCPPGVSVPLNHPDTVEFLPFDVNGVTPATTFILTQNGEPQSCNGGHGGIPNHYRATATFTDTVPGQHVWIFRLNSYNVGEPMDSKFYEVPYTIGSSVSNLDKHEPIDRLDYSERGKAARAAVRGSINAIRIEKLPHVIRPIAPGSEYAHVNVGSLVISLLASRAGVSSPFQKVAAFDGLANQNSYRSLRRLCQAQRTDDGFVAVIRRNLL